MAQEGGASGVALRRPVRNDANGADENRSDVKRLKRSHDDAEHADEQGESAGEVHGNGAARDDEDSGTEGPAGPAVAPPTAASMRLVTVLKQALHQDWHHNIFPFEEYVKREQGLRLDHVSSICPTFLKQGKCPLGNACPKRHVPLFHPPHSSASHNRDGTKRTVCKHWLRGLCKKGDGCDYLHEYDMRTMPECRFYATFGYCDMSTGAERECLYLHRDPKTKRRECENYRRGFCPKGPTCEKKHVRRVICPHYLAGFCPKGRDCTRGHPKVTRPSAESRRNSLIQTVRPMTAEEAFAPPPHLRDRMQHRGPPRDYGGGGGQDEFGRSVGMGGPQRWGAGGPGQGPPQAPPSMPGAPPGGMPGMLPNLQHLQQPGSLTPSQGGGSDRGTPAPSGPGGDAASVIPGFGNANAAASFAMSRQQQPEMQRGGPPFGGPPPGPGAGGFGAGGPPMGGGGPRRRDLSTVMCHKCGEMGHFANVCPNPNKPGRRGTGQERGRGGMMLGRGPPHMQGGGGPGGGWA